MHRPPIVKLLFEVLNLEIHDDFNRSPHVLKHLKPAYLLQFRLFFLQDRISDLVQL